MALNNIKKLRQLYANSTGAQAILDHFASRERSWSETTVDRIHNNVVGEGHEVSRGDVISCFKEFEQLGYGEFKIGRRGWPSRFVWSANLVTVGKTAAGEADIVEEINEADGANEEPMSTVKHTFMLRPDVPVSLELPSDFSASEAQRLGAFIGALPFQS